MGVSKRDAWIGGVNIYTEINQYFSAIALSYVRY
ncbi:hypothetical protein ACVW2L_002132 [Mucilaginibacter sp. HD30]